MPDLKEPGLGMECSNLAPNIGSSQNFYAALHAFGD